MVGELGLIGLRVPVAFVLARLVLVQHEVVDAVLGLAVADHDRHNNHREHEHTRADNQQDAPRRETGRRVIGLRCCSGQRPVRS